MSEMQRLDEIIEEWRQAQPWHVRVRLKLAELRYRVGQKLRRAA